MGYVCIILIMGYICVYIDYMAGMCVYLLDMGVGVVMWSCNHV